MSSVGFFDKNATLGCVKYSSYEYFKRFYYSKHMTTLSIGMLGGLYCICIYYVTDAHLLRLPGNAIQVEQPKTYAFTLRITFSSSPRPFRPYCASKPISRTILSSWLKSCEIIFGQDKLKFDKLTRPEFCIFHDSPAVVTCCGIYTIITWSGH